MASQGSVRGPHPQRLRLDEIDEMELAVLEGAQGQPMRKLNKNGYMVETQTVMSSTHQYPDKTMSHMLALAKERGYPVFEWCWRESCNPVDGWLSMEEVERQRSIIPSHMWETEYDLQEPSFEGRAIDTASVDAAFSPVLGEFTGDERIVLTEPGKQIYVTGIDWAKEKDWTVVATFDTRSDPWECVAWVRMQRLPWPVMIARALKQWREFKGYLVHDQTGLGNVINDQIDGELHYSEKAMVKGVVMVGRERQELFNEYIAGIEGGKLRYPRIEAAYLEHKYCTNEDLFSGTKKGHAPDSVVAGALAWTLRKKLDRGGTVMPAGGTRDSSPWT